MGPVPAPVCVGAVPGGSPDTTLENPQMRIARTLRATAAVAALSLALTACGGDDATTDEDPQTSSESSEAPGAEGEETMELALLTEGTLTVCTDAPYEPFEFEDPDAPSGYSGFDIDIVQEIADRLELNLAVVNSGFDPLLSGAVFASNTCDMGAAATTITEERDANIDFSDIYYSAIQSLAVPADSEITSLEELDGMKIGVQTGTTGETYAQDNAPEGAEIVSYDNPGDIFLALVAGEIDAILQDEPVNANREEASGDVKVVQTYDTGENYGLLFPEATAADLIAAVNAKLAEMREDGTYDAIFNEYFGA